MKFLLPLVLLALLNAHAAAPVDPFAPANGTDWTQELVRQKPYRLVIACGETKTPPPQDPTKPHSGAGGFIVTKEFMDVAKITTIAVAADDAGSLVREDGVEIQYRVKPEQKNFHLSLQLKANVGGKREINTAITIPDGSWQVIGLLSRQESIKDKDGETYTQPRYFSVAVRVDRLGSEMSAP